MSVPGVIDDPRVRAVLERLHRQADRQLPALLRHYLPRLPRLLRGGRIDWERDDGFYADKLIPVSPAQGDLLHLLTRAAGARRVVEFGTSFGVSTLYLAAAVRANGGGLVVGTELEPAKAAAARANLEAAGLSAFAEVREGDARETLRGLDGAVDLLLLDGWPSAASAVLDLVEPRLRPGAVVVLDNLAQFPGDLAEVAARLTPACGYDPHRLSHKGGTLIAVRR